MIKVGLSKIGDVPAATGGFADIWHGSYLGGRVAIKALKISRTSILKEVNPTLTALLFADLKII